MTDITRILPDFPLSQYASLIPTLEKHQVTTTDLLTLEISDIGKRTQLPLLDLKRLCNAILEALHSDLGVGGNDRETLPTTGESNETKTGRQYETLRHTLPTLASQRSTISTLDPTLDASLNGGIPTGYITEISGEAGAGKTQLLLSLLLAVQLPPPHGTGRNALYISTEAPLSTRRLTQILTNNTLFKDMPLGDRPSLDNILSTTTPDLESQEHILTYQVPVEVERRGIGLVVLDSVAANYRAEFERSNASAEAGRSRASQGSNMGARSAELVRLGKLLRDLARTHNLAVVVSNQVSDRFEMVSPLWTTRPQQTPTTSYKPKTVASAAVSEAVTHGYRDGQNSSPLAARGKNLSQPPLPHVEPSSSMADALPRSSLSYGNEEGQDQQQQQQWEERSPPRPPPIDEVAAPPVPPALTLDHQQRWFTGWGDDPDLSSTHSLKTPSLGLVWATQIACRIALHKAPRYGRSRYAGDDDDNDGSGGAGVPTLRSWRRWAKVVFAPHVAAMGPGLEGAPEFEINMGGLKGIVRETGGQRTKVTD